MSKNPHSPFQQSLAATKTFDAEQKQGEGKASPSTDPLPVSQAKAEFATRRAKGPRTAQFSQRIDQGTIDGLYTIAAQNDWTMNRTITEAYNLLREQMSQKG